MVDWAVIISLNIPIMFAVMLAMIFSTCSLVIAMVIGGEMQKKGEPVKAFKTHLRSYATIKVNSIYLSICFGPNGYGIPNATQVILRYAPALRSSGGLAMLVNNGNAECQESR